MSKEPIQIPRAVKLATLAREWGLHPRTLKRFIKSGELESVRLGPQLTLIPRDAAARFFEARRVK